MTPLEYVGATVVGLIGLGLSIIFLEICGNIYGGIKGAYRLRAIRARFRGEVIKSDLAPHWQTIRLGLRAWHGKRYDGDCGHYWQVGGMKVPVDGRDPIARERWYGA